MKDTLKITSNDEEREKHRYNQRKSKRGVGHVVSALPNEMCGCFMLHDLLYTHSKSVQPLSDIYCTCRYNTPISDSQTNTEPADIIHPSQTLRHMLYLQIRYNTPIPESPAPFQLQSAVINTQSQILIKLGVPSTLRLILYLPTGASFEENTLFHSLFRASYQGQCCRPGMLIQNIANGMSVALKQNMSLLVTDRVADPGCLSRIRIFSIPDPGSRVKKDSGSRIRIRNKELKYFNPKNCSKLSEI
jgi:hypothetical protein